MQTAASYQQPSPDSAVASRVQCSTVDPGVSASDEHQWFLGQEKEALHPTHDPAGYSRHLAEGYANPFEGFPMMGWLPPVAPHAMLPPHLLQLCASYPSMQGAPFLPSSSGAAGMWRNLHGSGVGSSGISSNSSIGTLSLATPQLQNSMYSGQQQRQPAWPSQSGNQSGVSGLSSHSFYDLQAQQETPEQHQQDQQEQRQQTPANDWQTPTSAQLHLHPDFDPELPTFVEELSEGEPHAQALFVGSSLQPYDKAIDDMSCGVGDDPLEVIYAGMPELVPNPCDSSFWDPPPVQEDSPAALSDSPGCPQPEQPLSPVPDLPLMPLITSMSESAGAMMPSRSMSGPLDFPAASAHDASRSLREPLDLPAASAHDSSRSRSGPPDFLPASAHDACQHDDAADAQLPARGLHSQPATPRSCAAVLREAKRLIWQLDPATRHTMKDSLYRISRNATGGSSGASSAASPAAAAAAAAQFSGSDAIGPVDHLISDLLFKSDQEEKQPPALAVTARDQHQALYCSSESTRATWEEHMRISVSTAMVPSKSSSECE